MLDYHFVKENISDGSIDPKYIPTKDQLVDVLSKTMTTAQHANLLRKVGVLSIIPSLRGSVEREAKVQPHNGFKRRR